MKFLTQVFAVLGLAGSLLSSNAAAPGPYIGATPVVSRADFNTNNTAVFSAIGSAAPTNSPLANATNALYVAINGNDATAQRNRRDLPFRTLGAANTNAFTNDTIFVAPGTWNEKIALRNMVNWHFDEGAIISATNSFRSNPTNQPGAIFDDFAGNTTNRITGYGRFEDLTVAPFFYSGVVNMTNQSFITFICNSAYSSSPVGTASSDNDLMDGRAGAVFYQTGQSNKLVVECRLTRAGLASYGVWWRGGDMRLQSQEIVGDTNNTGIVVASDVGTFSGATNVQMFVRAQRITHLGTNGVTTYTDSPTIYVSNLGADVRSWINAEYIESVGGAAIHANAGKYYINAQKILGAINDDNAGTTAEAYITAEKLATDNLFLSKNQPLIVSKSSKPQFYNFQVIEEGGITNAPIITHSGNGSAVFNGGWITRTNTGSIYYHTGTGTGVLSSVNFMAKSGETSISNAAGTLVVEGSYYGTTAGTSTITFQPEIVNLNAVTNLFATWNAAGKQITNLWNIGWSNGASMSGANTDKGIITDAAHFDVNGEGRFNTLVVTGGVSSVSSTTPGIMVLSSTNPANVGFSVPTNSTVNYTNVFKGSFPFAPGHCWVVETTNGNFIVWTNGPCPGGGGTVTSPGGSGPMLQFKDGSTFSGTTNWVFDETNKMMVATPGIVNTNALEFHGSNANTAIGPNGGIHVGGLTAVGGSNVVVEGTVVANGGGGAPTNSFGPTTITGAAQVIGAFNAPTNIASPVTLSNPTNSYTTGTLYTNVPGRSLLVGSAVMNGGVSGSANITLNYTNNGVGYQLPMQTGAGVATTDIMPFCVALASNATFNFVSTMGTGATGWLTNVVNWQH